jgi:hypothetical protein
LHPIFGADMQEIGHETIFGEAIPFADDETVAMPEYLQAIERYPLDDRSLSKPALVELLTKRFSDLSADQAWIIVSRYFNKRSAY